MYQFLRIDRAPDGVVTVTLDRPPVNAVSDGFAAELAGVAAELARDDAARLVFIRSALPMFMAGADLDVISAGWDSLDERIRRFQEGYNIWERLPVPTIAVITGHALGAGCELALACDWRYMVRGKARVGLPEVRHGLLPSAGGTQRTARLLGRANALDLNLRGRMLDADAAERIGLISVACDEDTLEAELATLRDELLALPRLTLAAVKRSVLAGLDTDFATGLDVEREEMVGLGKTADTHEGVRAFVEKRIPKFQHK